MPAHNPAPFLTSVRAVQAVGEDWSAAARALADALGRAGDADTLGRAGDGAALGFLYATDTLADDLGSVVTFLRQRTGIEHWIGGTGIGIFSGRAPATDREYFEAPALVALVVSFAGAEGDAEGAPGEAGAFSVFTLGLDGVAAPALPADALPADTMTAFIHADPMNEDTPDAIAQLAAAGPGFLIGGLTSARDRNVQIADGIAEAVLSGVAFAPGVQLATGLTQGCVPVGKAHRVSEVDGNILQGLDGVSALDALKADLGEEFAGDVDNDMDNDMENVAGLVHMGIPVPGSDTGDFTVRALAGIDPSRGWLLIGEAVEVGDSIFFVRRDGRSAEIDMIHMLENLKHRTLDAGQKIKGAVYISCIARGPAMFDEPGREMALIRDVLGDFPLAGFYASGEISASRLYGYTGVLTLFVE